MSDTVVPDHGVLESDDALKRDVIIYHAGCIDGFMAAYLTATRPGILERFMLVPLNYDIRECPLALDGHDRLTIVDFSFPRGEMQRLYETCGEMVVLDHHKTAQAECEGLEFCHFDMKECGTTLVMKHLRMDLLRAPGFDGTVLHRATLRVRDHDLWEHRFPDTRAFIAFLRVQKQDVSVWHKLFQPWVSWDAMIDRGNVVLSYMHNSILQHAAAAEWIKVGGIPAPVPLVNVSDPSIVSELLHLMCDNLSQMAIGWYRSGGKMIYSLRSKESGPDVSEIARRFRGGGHAHASGIITDKVLDWQAEPDQGKEVRAGSGPVLPVGGT